MEILPAELLIGKVVHRPLKRPRKHSPRLKRYFKRTKGPGADPREALRLFRALIEAHEMAHLTLAQDLAEERRRRERAEGLEAQLRHALALKEALLDEMTHRATNGSTIPLTSFLLLPPTTDSVHR